VLASHPLADMLPEPELPGGIFLAPSHLWVSLMAAGQARVGLDPLIRAAMGEPDRVESPVQGTHLRKGDVLFSARWGERSVAFRSPIEGTVQSAGSASGTMDSEGWVMTLQPAGAQRDLGLLPMAEEARRWFSQEWARLRDFVAAQSLQVAPAGVAADGGRPVEGWMRHEPEPAWDQFVESFLTQQNA
jgi:glycine cleavage system H lipoate-binding protein